MHAKRTIKPDGNHIRELRVRNGLTQKQLANKVVIVGEAKLRAIETKNEPTEADIIQALANYFGKTREDLEFREDGPSSRHVPKWQGVCFVDPDFVEDEAVLRFEVEMQARIAEITSNAPPGVIFRTTSWGRGNCTLIDCEIDGGNACIYTLCRMFFNGDFQQYGIYEMRTVTDADATWSRVIELVRLVNSNLEFCNPDAIRPASRNMFSSFGNWFTGLFNSNLNSAVPEINRHTAVNIRGKSHHFQIRMIDSEDDQPERKFIFQSTLSPENLNFAERFFAAFHEKSNIIGRDNLELVVDTLRENFTDADITRLSKEPSPLDALIEFVGRLFTREESE